MWKSKSKLNTSRADNVHLVLPETALSLIFDECDGFEQDETGGRVIGTFTDSKDKLTLNVTGIIESGPRAKRSAVSLFQDGEHQEGVFRQIEQHHPEIEHLGNWHTHHVNGLSTLSNGDIATYHRIVNHRNHNTPFFYALLVTAKHRTSDRRHRYSIKHYVFHRGEERFYEIPSHQIEIVDRPLVWPASAQSITQSDHARSGSTGARPDRFYDREIIGEFYQDFRPFASKKIGIYWRGLLDLLDGSRVQVVVVEHSAARSPSYCVALREPPASLKDVADELACGEFPSARAALITTERRCNRVIYQQCFREQEAKFPT